MSIAYAAMATVLLLLVCAILLGYRIRVGYRIEPVEVPRLVSAFWDDASLEEIKLIIQEDSKSVHMDGFPEFGTAMDCSLYYNRGDVVRFLLETGWDPNRDVESLRMRPSNPLGFAISSGELEIAQTLLDYGADPEKAFWHGVSGRDLCVECLNGEKQARCLRMLEDKAVSHAGDSSQ